MLISEKGISPDPEKTKALENLAPPKSKDELKSFLCMNQSNSDFIPCFSKRVDILRNLLHSKQRFRWAPEHQVAFNDVIAGFKEEAMLNYFDLSKNMFVFTDAHKSGIAAILAQGDSIISCKQVAFVSRSTNKAEKNYSQLDLEATAIDYSLRRFRNYLVGASKKVTIVTDHKPL